MNFIIQNILAALMPAAIDGVKQLIGKFTGGTVRATNIDEQIRLDTANVEKLKALASLDNPYGVPSQWVIDLRASFRYVAAGLVISLGVLLQFFPSVDAILRLACLDFAGIAFSFIFGDRVYINLKGKV